jgi:hypothetical protein
MSVGLCVVWITGRGSQSVTAWFGIGATKGLLAAGVMFLIYGGFDLIQHWALRLSLAASGFLPFRLSVLLRRATDLGFVSRIGGHYIFLHRELLAYFAARFGRQTLTDGEGTEKSQ